MRARTFQFARAILFVMMMTLGRSTAPARSSAHSIENARQGSEARLGPEVRLRKLHLVRPDLIPYPICYEIYC